MTKILSLLSLLSLMAGCASPEYAAYNASPKGDHAGAAKLYLRIAEQQEKDEKDTKSTSSGHNYCSAASEFLKAGGAENIRSAIAAAEKGIAKNQDNAEKYSKFADRDRAIDDPVGYESFLTPAKFLFMCKLTLAKSRLSNGEHEGVRAFVKNYTELDAARARFVFDNKVDRSRFQYGDSDYDNFGVNLVEFLRSHDSRLADAVEKHYRSSSLAVAEEQKQDAVIRQARKAKDARVESIKREQAALEAEAQAEYERQHPEIARAKQTQAAAEKQCAACKSSCDSQGLGCTAACFGNLDDAMCPTRCVATSESCKTSCEQQRDGLIVQAGGTPLGTSNRGTAALFQGLLAMGDSLAAAKGLPPPGASGFAPSATPSMQTSVASFAQALSALAGSAVVAPSSKSSTSQLAKAGGAPSASVGSTCDVSAEDQEIEAMEKRLPFEVKGLGKKKRECYAAKQYVKIAHFQIRAATRCNLDLTEPKEYLHDAEVQEREFCRDLSMK